MNFKRKLGTREYSGSIKSSVWTSNDLKLPIITSMKIFKYGFGHVKQTLVTPKETSGSNTATVFPGFLAFVWYA